MALSNATRLSDFGSGIGTEGAALKIDNANDRVGIGTSNPQAMLQVGQNITMDGGASGVVTATSFIGNLGGTTVTLGTGATNYSGIVSATEYYGSGANLTNVISGVEIKLSGTTVGTSATVLNFSSGFSTATPVSAGISTIETTRILTLGVRSGTAVTFSISGGSFNVSGRGGNVAIDV